MEALQVENAACVRRAGLRPRDPGNLVGMGTVSMHDRYILSSHEHLVATRILTGRRPLPFLIIEVTLPPRFRRSLPMRPSCPALNARTCSPHDCCVRAPVFHQGHQLVIAFLCFALCQTAFSAGLGSSSGNTRLRRSSGVTARRAFRITATSMAS